MQTKIFLMQCIKKSTKKYSSILHRCLSLVRWGEREENALTYASVHRADDSAKHTGRKNVLSAVTRSADVTWNDCY